MKFAVYYVPPEGEFYEFGSGVLGYDIRTQRSIPYRPGWIREQWVNYPRQYGFHATLTDAVELDPERLPDVEHRLHEILRCFSTADRYELEMGESPVTFWQPDIAVISTQPNVLVRTLHAALVCTLQILGTGSTYRDQIARKPDLLGTMPEHQVQKLKLFCSPIVLDDFKPHFTLLNGYDEARQPYIARRLNESLRQDRKTIEMETVCLVVQKAPGSYFEIYKEIRLHDRTALL